jgi:hypothetical protein
MFQSSESANSMPASFFSLSFGRISPRDSWHSPSGQAGLAGGSLLGAVDPIHAERLCVVSNDLSARRKRRSSPALPMDGEDWPHCAVRMCQFEPRVCDLGYLSGMEQRERGRRDGPTRVSSPIPTAGRACRSLAGGQGETTQANRNECIPDLVLVREIKRMTRRAWVECRRIPPEAVFASEPGRGFTPAS